MRRFRRAAARVFGRPLARAIAMAGLAGALLAPTFAAAGELVVFERRGCVYCQRFDAEVAPIYEKTDEARSAPLRRVDLGSGVPGDLALATPVRFTPTFVLMDKGREIGRITGYISDDMFWGLLAPMTAKLSESH